VIDKKLLRRYARNRKELLRAPPGKRKDETLKKGSASRLARGEESALLRPTPEERRHQEGGEGEKTTSSYFVDGERGNKTRSRATIRQKKPTAPSGCVQLPVDILKRRAGLLPC